VTREEAAMKLSLHLMQCGVLMPIEWVQRNGEGSETSEAFQMAIAALREQGATDINIGHKGCKACEMTTRGLTYKQIEYGTLRGDFINDSSGMYIIRYGGGQHSIVCDNDGAEIDIEFCPVCGRRLEEV